MLQREIEIKIMNQPINITNSYKYLGVEIDHSLDLNSHFERTYEKMTTRRQTQSLTRRNQTESNPSNVVHRI